MNLILRSAILTIFFLLPLFSFGQKLASEDTLATISEKDEILLLRADELFELKNYVGAMNLFDTLSHHYPQSVLFKFKTGICFLHTSSKHDKALLYLKDVKLRRPDLEAIDYYLGRALLYNYFYDEAIKCFKTYAEILPKRNEVRFDVSHFIDYCLNGKEILKEPLNVYIENLGKPVNTDNSEYVPVIASDESFMIFTYRGERSKGGRQDARNRPNSEGEYYEDIFITYRVGKHWLDPEPLGNINTNDHDAAIALSVDGQKLFVFKATKKDKGDIYQSVLKGYDWSVPTRLNGNVNTNYWEGSISMTSDEQCIYFTSDRPGGYGGRDIYRSRWAANGDWGPAENLGPEINTQYNEDAPYVHPNTRLLYFSSEGHNSIGGYDIFKSEIIRDSLSRPQNLGFPINTSTDDKYISISTNGAHAYYSSGVDEGLGQQDIYAITPGIPGKKPQVAVIKGKVTGNEKAISATIKVLSTDGKHNFGTFYSNSESGKYLLVLFPYTSYRITFEAQGFSSHNEYVNTASLRSSVEVEEDIHLYSADYSLPRIVSKDTIGFIYTRLDEEIFKLDSLASNDDQLLALAREREEERAMNIPTNSASFRIATDATIKRILAQNALLQAKGTQTEKVLYDSVKVTAVNQTTRDSVLANQEKLPGSSSPEGNTQALSNADTSIVQEQNLVTNNNKSVEKSQEKNLGTNQSNGSINPEKIELPTGGDRLPQDAATPVFGVYYKVQIGAYRKAQNFKYSTYEVLGKVEALKLEDGITRFTIGNFETLEEAQSLRIAAIAKGIKDAWITATVNGERKLLNEIKLSSIKILN